MKGLSFKRMLKLIKQDVERIKTEAKIVIKIDRDGNVVSWDLNPDGRINVLAIIGPVGFLEEKVKNCFSKADFLGELFKKEEILLLEIGMKRAKPYRVGFDRQKKNGTSYIPLRQKWFFLSSGQYCRIAPVLFQWLQRETSTRMDNWKENIFLRKKKGFQKEVIIEKLLSAGICFSISLKDAYFISDILWASSINEVRKKFLKWLCEMSVKMLSVERKKQKIRENLKECLMRSHNPRPHYVIEDMLEFLPKEKRFLYNDIADLAGWNQKETEERRLRNAALPNPQIRVGNIELRIERIDKKREYLVFEVFSNKTQ